MNMNITLIIAVLSYFAGGLVTGLRLFGVSQQLPRLLGIGLGLVGVVFHAVLLYQGIFTEAGINLSFFTALSLSAFTIILLLLISSLGKPVEILGIVLLPVAALSILLEMRFPGVRLLNPDAEFGLKLHVLISILSYSLFSIAALQALVLALQERKLRSHHPGGFVRAMPPLQTMESLLFEMLTVAFVLLGVALITGFLFLQDMFAQHLVHKTVLSLISWFVFGILLWGRYQFGWRGRTAIRWTLTGFFILLLAYFGSKAVLELILNK